MPITRCTSNSSSQFRGHICCLSARHANRQNDITRVALPPAARISCCSSRHTHPSTMTNARNEHWPLGTTGIAVPPICFGSAALGNVGRVIPEQSKLEICGEWLHGPSPPLWIEADYRHGDGMALEVLGRLLGRLDVASERGLRQVEGLRSPRTARDSAGDSAATRGVDSPAREYCSTLSARYFPVRRKCRAR